MATGPINGDRSAAVLVIDQDRKHLAWLTRIVRTLVGEAEAASSPDVVHTVGDFGLVLADYDGMTAAQRTRLFAAVRDSREATGGPHLLLVSSARDVYPAMFQEFEEYGLANVLTRSGEVNPTDLIVTLQKIRRRDIFGIEKYFAWGVEAQTRRVTASIHRAEVLREAERYAADLGVHPRLCGHFCTVVDELVTNALYNSPVDKRGRPRFAHLSRTEPVELEPDEEVLVTFCCDAQLLGVSVSDSFGALSKERSLDYLARCFRKEADQVDVKQGGAGLGMYFMFDSLSHLIFNIRPGFRTEVIGLIDVRGSYRDFWNRGKSFNIFVDQEPHVGSPRRSPTRSRDTEPVGEPHGGSPGLSPIRSRDTEPVGET